MRLTSIIIQNWDKAEMRKSTHLQNVVQLINLGGTGISLITDTSEVMVLGYGKLVHTK